MGVFMAYEHKPGQGSAFINRDKKEDWHAEFKGDVMLPDGTIHWLEVTPKKTQAGDDFYKVKIGGVKVSRGSAHSEAKSNGYQPQPQVQPQVAAPDDDIPW
jgi:hypothetical protein